MKKLKLGDKTVTVRDAVQEAAFLKQGFSPVEAEKTKKK